MGASTQTPNVNLPQFADTDKPTWRGDVNSAMLAIDAAFAAKQAEIDLLNNQVGTVINPSNVKIWYVHPTVGNDANNGLTPGNAFRTIAHAITASGGTGQIFLLPGIHVEAGPLSITGTDLEITGVPGASVITFTNNIVAPTITVTGSRIRIHNILFDGGTQTATHVGFKLINCSDVTIEQVRFRNNTKGIWIADSASVRTSILNNYFESTTVHRAVCADSFDTDSIGASDILIQGNYVDNVQSALGDHAFFLEGSNIQIIGNRVQDCIDTACMVVAAHNVSIANNIFRSKQICIFTGNGSTNIKINGNDLTSYNDNAIALYDAPTYPSSSRFVVSGNNIHECYARGISVSDVSIVTITGNVITNVGKSGVAIPNDARCGISVQANTGGKNIPPANLAITGNTIVDDQATHTTMFGILLESLGANVEVSANVCVNCVNGGVASSASYTGRYYVELDTIIISSKRQKVTSLSSPVMTSGSGAGAAPPAIVPALSNKDEVGYAFFGTGTGANNAGPLIHIAFATVFDVAPKAILAFGANNITQALGLFVDTGSITVNGFDIWAANAPASSHAVGYEVTWIVIP
jgi:hypothetical protein